MLTGSADYISPRKTTARLAQSALAIALLVLAGWSFRIDSLTHLVPGFTAMNPLTAVLLLLSSAALWLHQQSDHSRKTTIVQLCATITVIAAFLRLLGASRNLDLGIDQLIFHDGALQSRMSIATAVDFTLCGASLFFLSSSSHRSMLVSQVLALLSLVVSLASVVGFLFLNHGATTDTARLLPMAMHTAVAFLLLSAGLLFASSRYGFMSVIMRKSTGGVIARILLPITLIIPVILGWLRMEGQHNGFFTSDLGTALLTVATIVVFATFIWILAWSINRSDQKRKQAVKAMLAAKMEAERAKQTQELFLANMSHEIRTPINGIIGMVQLIDMTDLSEEVKEYVDIINESASNLLVIINDILDLTKMAAGKIVLEDVNYSLRDTVKTLVKIYHYKATRKGIALKYEIDNSIPSTVFGDPVRLNQILNNLLSNAVKFTRTGEIRLRINAVNENDETLTVRFNVEDTGIGIPEDKLSHIFDSFTQASADTTRKYGGTGLGLTISKQLVELQGGQISVSSRMNEGSVFSFFLPLKKISASIPVEESAQQNAFNMDQLKVLLAEDNVVNQKVASQLLSKKGVQVEIANNGMEVLNMLSKENFHLILMDINMPVMDGYETTQHIRQNDSFYQKIPIIALTASAFDHEKTKCFQVGMDDYLAKPFKAVDLFEKISAYTGLPFPEA